ncbi:MAG: cell division protein FtsQ/DivIB [Pseudomonadota bacterium]
MRRTNGKTPVVAALPADVRIMNAAALAMAAMFVVMALSAALFWGLQQPLFALRAIRVEGELTHNNAVTLRANVAPKLTGNFFTLNLANARAAFESVPWVREAEVRREFPNRLKVLLKEHEPAAYWGSEDETRLLNLQGQIFEVNQGDVEAEDLPVLSGPASQAALVLQAYRVLAPLFSQLDTSLSKLELTGRGSWRARLESGAVVEMGPGTPDEIQVRAQRFVATVAQTSSKFGRNFESADLRYSNGYALRLRGVTTVAPGEKTDRKTR